MSGLRIAALVACLLALVQAAVLCKERTRQQDLCGYLDPHLQSINDLHRTSTNGCSDYVKEAFEALKLLVEEPNVCTMDKANKLIRFYEDYLRDPEWQARQTKAQISITKFAIAYGMQVSRHCRSVMVLSFYGGATSSLEASDFEAIKEWTRNDSPIARLLGSITKRGEFLLPSDFLALAPEVMDKLKLKMTKDSGKILVAQEVCKKRFRPVYEPFVMPIAHLTRNGLKYNRFSHNIGYSAQHSMRREHALWSRIVFVCESLKEIEVVGEPAESTGQSDDTVANEGAVAAKSTVELPVAKTFKPFSLIDGKTSGTQARVVDSKKYPLFSSASFRLTSAMKSFNVTMSETERFRKRVLSNKWSLLITTFKSNEQTRTLLKKAFGMVMDACQRGRNQDQELQSAKKNLLVLVDAKKNSTVYRVIAKILRGGKKAVLALQLALEIVILLSVLVAFIVAGLLDVLKGMLSFRKTLVDKLTRFFDDL